MPADPKSSNGGAVDLRLKLSVTRADSVGTVSRDRHGVTQSSLNRMSQTAPREDLRFEVRHLAELPPLSHTAQSLIEMLGDDDVDIGPLSEVIDRSPAIAARVVGLARSAYFGQVAGVESVQDAIIKVLGLSLVKSVALGIALSGGLDAARCAGFSVERYWSGALLTANLGRLLSLRARAPLMPGADNAYLCGLLHSIGMLTFAHLLPTQLSEVLRRAAAQPERGMVEWERELIGVDHAEVGGWLMERWHLPPEVCASAQHHNDPDYRGPYWQAALLTGLCASWGRQRLAGVAAPWVRPDVASALGLEDEVLAGAVEQCNACVEQVATLARTMSAH